MMGSSWRKDVYERTPYLHGRKKILFYCEAFHAINISQSSTRLRTSLLKRKVGQGTINKLSYTTDTRILLIGQET